MQWAVKFVATGVGVSAELGGQPQTVAEKLALAKVLKYNAGVDTAKLDTSQEDGGFMPPKIKDVERVKKQVRKLAAGKVLWGDAADVCLDLAQLEGCQVRVAAGYGQLSEGPQPNPCDQFIWILDGYAEIHVEDGVVTRISQGESTILQRDEAYQLLFPQLTLYLLVEPTEDA